MHCILIFFCGLKRFLSPSFRAYACIFHLNMLKNIDSDLGNFFIVVTSSV